MRKNNAQQIILCYRVKCNTFPGVHVHRNFIASWNKLPNQGQREVKSELEFKHLISVVSNITSL
jgi:hypothetical protein